MDLLAAFQSGRPTIPAILATMAVVAAIETVIPLHARERWNRDHLAPNLALTFLTFATNLFFNAALLAALAAFGASDFGLLRAFALAIGASPAAFAIYRLWSVLNGLFEHANIRLPLWLDTALSAVVTSPNMHKVHHSRAPAQTDTNYGNIFSVFDRSFGTFTPAAQGVAVVCGLDGFDDAATQTTTGLLALPFRAPANLAAPLPVFGSVASATERDHELSREISTGTPVMNA